MANASPPVSGHAPQATRDLEWLLSLPTLLDHPSAWEHRPFTDSEFELAAATAFLEKEGAYRVGVYAEKLIQGWLLSQPNITSVEAGVILRDEHRTLGELDFVFESGGEVIQLELALKFYLYHETSTRWESHYIGPNAGDTFERKRDRLLNHQLTIGIREKPEIDRSATLVKGIIFYHPEQNPPSRLPTFLAPGHRRGVWLHQSEFRRVGKDLWGAYSGAIMEKPYWMSAGMALAEARNFDRLADQVDGHFNDSDRPLMMALESEQEEVRLFVVADSWPE